VRSKPRFALTGPRELHSRKRRRRDSEDGVKKSPGFPHSLLNFYIFRADLAIL
jgi:hypothetical protein